MKNILEKTLITVTAATITSQQDSEHLMAMAGYVSNNIRHLYNKSRILSYLQSVYAFATCQP